LAEKELKCPVNSAHGKLKIYESKVAGTGQRMVEVVCPEGDFHWPPGVAGPGPESAWTIFERQEKNRQVDRRIREETRHLSGKELREAIQGIYEDIYGAEGKEREKKRHEVRILRGEISSVVSDIVCPWCGLERLHTLVSTEGKETFFCLNRRCPTHWDATRRGFRDAGRKLSPAQVKKQQKKGKAAGIFSGAPVREQYKQRRKDLKAERDHLVARQRIKRELDQLRTHGIELGNRFRRTTDPDLRADIQQQRNLLLERTRNLHEKWNDLPGVRRDRELRNVDGLLTKLQNQLNGGHITQDYFQDAKKDLDERRKEIEEQFKRDSKQYEEEIDDKLKELKESYKKPWTVRRYGESVIQKGFYLIAAAALGITMSALLGQIWFMFAFFAIGFYFVTPAPQEGNLYKGKNIWYQMMNPLSDGRSHATFGWMRSFFKISAITLFAFGFRALGGPFNIAFLIVCLGGYFSLKTAYDPDIPGERIESLMRFLILGCYLIPFYLFGTIFNSNVLAILALAFFAVPPVERSKKGTESSEEAATGEFGAMFDKALFVGLMFIALLGSGALNVVSPLFTFGPGWELTGTLRATFLYFWFVSFIAGLFSSRAARPEAGLIMLGAATVIYGIGPGSQDIGSGLLGQWWPTVHNGVAELTEPLAEVMMQLGNTLGQAVFLLTNPIGYTQQILNGTYATDPTTGLKGALGVEFDGKIDVTPIFPGQPFSIVYKLKNSGAFETSNVNVTLTSNMKFSDSGGKIDFTRVTVPISQFGFNATEREEVCIDKDGVDHQQQTSKDEPCYQVVHYPYVPFPGGAVGSYQQPSGTTPETMTKLDIRQGFFQSNGFSCSEMIGAKHILDEIANKLAGGIGAKRITSNIDLRNFYIPFNITVTYPYQIDSSIDVELISQGEWDRLVADGKLVTQTKKASTFTNAPVQLNLDTLEQPIREKTPLFIGLSLVPVQKYQASTSSQIESAQIQLIIPNALGEIKSCTNNKFATTPGATATTYTWKPENIPQGMTTIFCYFQDRFTFGNKNIPTQTFQVRAHADYIFAQTKTVNEKVEFGGVTCCETTNDCPYAAFGQTCNNNICGDFGNGTSSNGITGLSSLFGKPGYCEAYKEQTKSGCRLGAGGCDKTLLGADADCDQVTKYDLGGNSLEGLACKTISTTSGDLGVCCLEDSGNPDNCKKAYEQWLSTPLDDDKILKAFQEIV